MGEQGLVPDERGICGKLVDENGKLYYLVAIDAEGFEEGWRKFMMTDEEGGSNGTRNCKKGY